MQQYVLPSGINGQYERTAIAGASLQHTYECIDSVWTHRVTTGVCECEEEDGVQTFACNHFLEGNWTGNATQTFTRYCPSGLEERGEENTSSCVCSADTENEVEACSSGYSAGQITMQRQWICDTATAGHYSNWIVASNTCTCTPQTQDQLFDCPAGHTGSGIMRRNTLVCNSGDPTIEGTWDNFATELWSDCTCNPGTTETMTTACPEGEVGVKEFSRTFNCVSLDWNQWTLINNYCGPITYQWSPMSSQSGSGPAQVGVPVGAPCDLAGASSACYSPQGSGYAYYDNCRCQ